MEEKAPAAWYSQPDGSQRYWDGEQWTEHTAPGNSAAPQSSGEPPTPTATDVDARPLWKKKRFFIPLAIVALFISLCGLGGVFALGSQEPEASPSPTSSPESSPAPTPEPTSGEPSMPDVVGMTLDDAQGEMPMVDSASINREDASGDGRVAVVFSDWRVCAQTPAPGQAVTSETAVTLASVRDDESCPGDEPEEP